MAKSVLISTGAFSAKQTAFSGRCAKCTPLQLFRLSLASTIQVSAIGKGFARLDDETYNRVICSQIEYETGEKGEYASFPFATLPYASPQDPRKIYHDNIAETIIEAQQNHK